MLILVPTRPIILGYFIFAIVVLATPAMADFNTGLEAYKRGHYAAALREWRPLAEQGDADSQYSVGFMYNNGEGVPKDYSEAVKWFRRAAEQGNAKAQTNLGGMYFFGQGVEQDYLVAYAFFNIAAAQGSEKAAGLRDILEKQFTPEDVAMAQFELAKMYRFGKGVPQNDTEAVRWYREAAGQGYSPAQDALGAMYFNGLGVQQDKAKAVKWWRAAAEQGFRFSLSRLAGLYASGEVVSQDYVVAHMLLTLLEAQGSVKAVETRFYIEKNMTQEQIDQAQRRARECLAKNFKGCGF